jgi:SAM-dependent methyltransferase
LLDVPGILGELPSRPGAKAFRIAIRPRQERRKSQTASPRPFRRHGDEELAQVENFLKDTAKRALGALGLEVRRVANASPKPWDQAFKRWIAQARAAGKDPNDVGDAEWAGDPSHVLETTVSRFIDADSVVLELGPGTGRATRHVLPRCRRMILVDYSQFVCDWLDEYLAGRGNFETHQIDRPVLAGVPAGVVDFAFAYGVFEHIDLDDTYELIKEFQRVLKAGGSAWFNFDTLATSGGLTWFKQQRAKLQPGQASEFRFHHPEDIAALCRDAGFEVSNLETNETRQVWVTLRKP